MKAQRKKDITRKYDTQKEFRKIDMLFSDLEKDKTLPTFGEHYMQCLILGVVEKVNLKKMYPGVYKKLNAFYKEHEQAIISSRK